MICHFGDFIKSPEHLAKQGILEQKGVNEIYDKNSIHLPWHHGGVLSITRNSLESRGTTMFMYWSRLPKNYF